MNTRHIKLRSIGKTAHISGEFLFRRSRKGPVESISDAAAKVSRAKVSQK